ncbi:unnamed protein product [Trichobilharzia regenti]|nr:unnamed protein product [Trichobilharzia regenti]
MPKKIQNFAKSALVKPVTVNVGRAGAASMNVSQEVEYVKHEAKIPHLLSALQKTPPPVSYCIIFFLVFNYEKFRAMITKCIFYLVNRIEYCNTRR